MNVRSWFKRPSMAKFILVNSSCMADEIRITWRVPVITLVLAATAIPVEFRPLGNTTLDFGIGVADVLANVAGYLPVGIVLAEFGLARAILAAGLLSMFAEAGQFFMVHRDPSAIDVTTNILGATLGAFIRSRWRIPVPVLRINRGRALAAAVLALLVIGGMWATSGAVPNPRGVTAPGGLEAHWKFDENGGRRVVDSSPHGLNGRLHGALERVTGRLGGAMRFNGNRDCVDFGQSSALRIVGSMTISAWIKPSSFPADDAAIVSSLNNFGFQLDTTIDKGPRTIGFKLTNECGELMARYGATPLEVNTWHHVAGVYNAGAKTLEVYLNGELDNGFLLGTVSGLQHSSREKVYVGRRSRPRGFEFAGAIDDVRIYSLALSKSEIQSVMRGADIDGSPLPRNARGNDESVAKSDPQPAMDSNCKIISDPEDSILPTAACVLGVLVAVACTGLGLSPRTLTCLAASFASGLLLLTATSSSLPWFNLWLIPLTSVAGSVSVAASLSRQKA